MINICDETTDVICKTKNSLEKKTEFFDLSIYFDILNQRYINYTFNLIYFSCVDRWWEVCRLPYAKKANVNIFGGDT